MEYDDAQPTDIDMNGTPVPAVSAPSASAACSSSAAPAVVAPQPGPTLTSLTAEGGKRQNADAQDAVLPRSRRL
eukprot:3958993-Alexandrium_andersonii.AAC.1